MSNVIDFKTPAQLREELAAKDEEIKALKTQITNLSAVKEMLTLQACDLQNSVNDLISQMQVIQNNLDNLLKRLSKS
jgi:predicted  nucleic acid-binding Zn-ribbon protein